MTAHHQNVPFSDIVAPLPAGATRTDVCLPLDASSVSKRNAPTPRPATPTIDVAAFHPERSLMRWFALRPSWLQTFYESQSESRVLFALIISAGGADRDGGRRAADGDEEPAGRALIAYWAVLGERLGRVDGRRRGEGDLGSATARRRAASRDWRTSAAWGP